MGYFFWDPIPRSSSDPTRIAAFVAALLAAQDELSELGDVNIPAPNDGEALIYHAATGKWIASVAPGAAAGEGHITILPLSYDSIGQGTWALLLLASNFLYGQFYNTSDTDGDNLSFKLYLDAGTYTLLFLTRTAPALGIADFDLDGAEIASFDCYTANSFYNVLKKQTGIVVATAGLYTLKLRLDGKHASSTGYIAVIIYINLWRTA